MAYGQLKTDQFNIQVFISLIYLTDRGIVLRCYGEPALRGDILKVYKELRLKVTRICSSLGLLRKLKTLYYMSDDIRRLDCSRCNKVTVNMMNICLFFKGF